VQDGDCDAPAALGLILWWKHGRLAPRDIFLLLPLFIVALGVAMLTSGMEQWNVGLRPEFMLSFTQRVLIAGRAIGFYAGKLFGRLGSHLFIRDGMLTQPRCGSGPFPASVLVVVRSCFCCAAASGVGCFARSCSLSARSFPGLASSRLPDEILICGRSLPIPCGDWPGHRRSPASV